MNKKELIKSTETYCFCNRCNSNSANQPDWVPCPRVDCEAKSDGKVFKPTKKIS